ncbi:MULTISPECIES: cyclic di-3',5'-guanylate-activated glycosyltransferase NrfB [Pseudomonas]|uniref:cyclic di-3',5'-guanylate-activated glycosyltransferase NfrB n=1 Tax=Pseudomonas TaxID=286 RepID=UPI000878D958|nr:MULTISPECIES: cyclic di-3',5'-guanylate-activated glycosyltransferase NrfB [Pseudomonas]AOX09554.1 type II secretion system protein E [Pseudomonas putida JB]MCI1025276.1 phage adsorption protein NrfB [Pseudomonas putida]MDN4515598.1 cyclic di-3',5'-guanylate-activated glycosyltransferase NrfB [Pseudomonas sp. 2,4-D]PWY44591.1 phage adsorption protein NrfB [Pseudomonas sp. RW405]SIS09469.1 adsorption protein B [Pseudomonas putida]
MSLVFIDFLTYLLFGLKLLAITLASLMFLLGLDDLFIDLCYWGRTLIRRFRIYGKFERADEKRLYEVPEKPLAIMVPAWNEVGVVGEMARLAASTIDYENYQIFVGTYPNDPQTQADVDAVCLHFPNVHKVVCARPGPTSKADCLNNIIDALLRFQQDAGIEFAGFILHDAEDVISPMELRLFNYLLPSKDMIQIPVYPYAPEWKGFTAGHYVDEFAENHGKDVIVREALTGQVPSAGVGTCFSRRAISALLEDGDGIAFDVQSLTEDYDIGFRLKQKGMKCIFARYSITDPALTLKQEWRPGMSREFSQVICVREHFPRDWQHAIRQKSRWIVGIVFQGTSNLGWSRKGALNYFLWRDRRGLFAYLLSFLVNLLLLVLLAMWLVTVIAPESWRFMSILSDSWLLSTLLWLNGLMLLNRLFQRAWFVTRFYGIGEGLLSAPRMMWSNFVNFFANLRALRQVMEMGDSRRVAWDKTTHEFPAIASPARTPLGQRLVAKGLITDEQLQQAITSPVRRRLGRELLLRGWLNSEQLVATLAEQLDLPWAPLNPFKLSPQLIAKLPRKLATHYGVLPVDEDGDTLILASESPVSQVSLGVISRQLKRPVKARLAPQGRVTLGLRYHYPSPLQRQETRDMLAVLERHQDDEALLERVSPHQVMLGALLQVRGMVPVTLFNQALIDFDPEHQSLGEHLIARGIITRQVLEQALIEQASEQQVAIDLTREVA